MNNSTNGTSNSTEADAGQASISIIDALVADAFSFVELAKVDPVAALIQHQRLVVFVVIVAALPFLYRTVTKLLELPNVWLPLLFEYLNCIYIYIFIQLPMGSFSWKHFLPATNCC